MSKVGIRLRAEEMSSTMNPCEALIFLETGEVPGEPEIFKVVRRGCAKLPSATRKVIRLFSEGASPNECSAELKIEVGECLRMHRRGIRFLRKYIKENK